MPNSGLPRNRATAGWSMIQRSGGILVDWPLRRSLVSPALAPRVAQLLCFAAGPKAQQQPDSEPLLTQPAKLWGKVEPKTPQLLASSRASSQPPEGNGDGQDDSTWGVFDISRYSGSWQVPWGPGRVAGGIALWFGSFVGVGFVLVPQLYRMGGISLSPMDASAEDKATFTLVCQAAETVVSLALIRVLTAGPIAEAASTPPSSAGPPSTSTSSQPSEGRLDFFVYDPRRAFSRPRGWAFWALLGMVASPAVVGSVAALMSAVGYEQVVGGKGTVDGVAGMIDLDLPTYLSLLAVTGVLAPVLEETVFRGFLLTSLTRFMPTWAAVVASSVSFGLAHLSTRDLPVLSALGLLLGWSYVRSRNLLTPIVIHGAWNSAVLSLLFWLAAEGVDVQQLISDLHDGGN
ncbi:hypothetical protein Vretifemale_11937 [Volvox reticuliferus]|uniref:CAAX prenyl protease 2/Lysostaphin resistance protein A-like domain-containing protein n=1 Tax=Volvox reticuliferus TaxID=1737510 RepID=A0A8J4CIH8_9CHLO|nr:hypothetical protein Vretifemale_11937 [Volvox reticuliferus]